MWKSCSRLLLTIAWCMAGRLARTEKMAVVFAGRHQRKRSCGCNRICDGLGFLGIELEEKQNAANEGVISAATGRTVRVIHTNEELMIAKMVCDVLGLGWRKGFKQ